MVEENGGVLEFIADYPMTPRQREKIDELLEETKKKIRIIFSSKCEDQDTDPQSVPVRES